MLGDNIKKYRKEKGYTQEELSGMLHVVRQTLSKWEKNVSVPDAEALIRISKALNVPVSMLLDLPQEEPTMDLAGELARVNAELAERNGQLQKNALAGKKRGQIIFLSFVALMIMISVHNSMVSLILVGGCFGLALLILYRNLSLLSESTVLPAQIKALKTVTVFCALVRTAGGEGSHVDRTAGGMAGHGHLFLCVPLFWRTGSSTALSATHRSAPALDSEG